MGDELILKFIHADARPELVFAALQSAVIAIEQGQNVEPDRPVNNARPLELMGNAASIVLAHDHDDFVGLERSGAARFLQEPCERSDSRERAEQHERRRSAQARKAHSPGLVWRLRRRWRGWATHRRLGRAGDTWLTSRSKHDGTGEELRIDGPAPHFCDQSICKTPPQSPGASAQPTVA